jgi:hypothetical protein
MQDYYVGKAQVLRVTDNTVACRKYVQSSYQLLDNDMTRLLQ